MLWMMIPCLLLLGVLFFSGGKLFSGGLLSPILIGVFVVAHIWMMFKGHGGHSNNNTKDKITLPVKNASSTEIATKTESVQNDGSTAKQSETKVENDKHKGGGCCH